MSKDPQGETGRFTVSHIIFAIWKVLSYCDNQVVVSIDIYVECIKFTMSSNHGDLQYPTRYINIHHDGIADALSRLPRERFRNATYSADTQPIWWI